MNDNARLLRSFRPSFTLIELLVVMAIIGSMVGMVLFALAGARQDAAIARTRHTIEKLNAVILQEWEEFRYKAVNVKIDPQWLRPTKQGGMVGQPALSPREGARLRMVILRDLMRMELPDRVTDIWYPPTAYKVALFTANNAGGMTTDDLPYYAGSTAPGTAPGLRYVPPRMNIYRLRLGMGAFSSPYALPVAPNPATLPPKVNGTNQGAEMLYQIVATSTYQGGAALEAFRPQEIGDTDGDGMLEFIDAWGNPIRWLRWPAGFPSPLNNPSQPDAMDPLRTDWRWSDNGVAVKPWLLVPLIISAGPDGVFDIAFDKNPAVVYATQTWSGSVSSPAYAQAGPYYFPDPYFGAYGPSGGLGTPFDEDGDGTTRGAADNITNHSLLLE